MPIVVGKLEAAKRFIPNLRFVSEHVVRGGQPDPDGLAILKEAGVKTIVNLRSSESGLVGLFRRSAPARVDPELERERLTAAELGLRFIQIPLDVFGSPADEHFMQFLELAMDPQSGPFFVHCLYGRDRTGLMMAIYRVVVDGWDAEKAYTEMLECGFDADRTNLSDAFFVFARKHRSV